MSTTTIKKPTKSAPAPSGFEAFGHRVPSSRRARAWSHLKQMGVTNSVDEQMLFIDSVCVLIERDNPHAALWYMTEASFPIAASHPDQEQPRVNKAPFHLDVTGGYRLLAVLCTDG